MTEKINHFTTLKFNFIKIQESLNFKSRVIEHGPPDSYEDTHQLKIAADIQK